MAVLYRQAGYPPNDLPILILALFCCCLAASSVALFYSVFLHPLLAAMAGAVTLVLPYVAQAAGGHLAGQWFPVFAAVGMLEKFQLDVAAESWTIAVAAILWTLAFLAAGAAVFNRRDVTTAPE
jgi:ABC-type transport system involved in multi-copper enzyme maturation permease subunit